MKKLNYLLTVIVASAIAPQGFAAEAQKDATLLEAIKEKKVAVGTAVAAGAGAYLSRDIQVYRDGIYPLPMNDMKEADILKRTDDMLAKADTSHIPNKGIINKAKIALKEQNRPIVVILKETPNSSAASRLPEMAAKAAPADKTGLAGLITKLVGLSKISKEEIKQDVLKDGGKPYLQAQLDGLKADRQVTVPKAYVTPAGRRLANLGLKSVAGASLLYVGGTLALDFNSLNAIAGELQACEENKDGTVICANNNAQVKRAPAAHSPRDEQGNQIKDVITGK